MPPSSNSFSPSPSRCYVSVTANTLSPSTPITLTPTQSFSSQSQQMLCVTAGNDGWVKLWDVNRQKQQSHKTGSHSHPQGGGKLVQPLLLCQTRYLTCKWCCQIHYHTHVHTHTHTLSLLHTHTFSHVHSLSHSLLHSHTPTLVTTLVTRAIQASRGVFSTNLHRHIYSCSHTHTLIHSFTHTHPPLLPPLLPGLFTRAD